MAPDSGNQDKCWLGVHNILLHKGCHTMPTADFEGSLLRRGREKGKSNPPSCSAWLVRKRMASITGSASASPTYEPSLPLYLQNKPECDTLLVNRHIQVSQCSIALPAWFSTGTQQHWDDNTWKLSCSERSELFLRVEKVSHKSESFSQLCMHGMHRGRKCA